MLGRSIWVVFLLCATFAAAAEPTEDQVEFFEKRIRPLLVRSCYACHSGASDKPMGGLRVDTREALLRGGQRGPALKPGSPEESLLVRAVRHADGMKMPPSGRLPEEQIADLAAWIKMGAPDPRERAAQPRPATADLWSLRPVKKPDLPKVKRTDWVRSPVDAFVLAALEDKGLGPAKPADRMTLLRRVTYDLTGLPPTPEELDRFAADRSPQAFEREVDRLLASPHYGERWGRHWLDLVRYAETNGHEYDNDKLAPWRYRDYVIRAFNEDVPYDQFVREHIAGDLLERPRFTRDGAFAESPLGTTFFWFGEVLNSATDSVKSRADEVDNQIDVTGKAFLGLTVACARCHDHKFDPIPTADYYALAGVFHSTELREGVIDSPERQSAIAAASRKILESYQPSKPSPVIIRWRPEDRVFTTRWRTSGAAFGDGAELSSLAAGADVFTGTLTSPKFQTDEKLFLHVRLGGTKADPALRERGPLRFTIVADGYKGQHIVPDGSAGTKWKTLRLTFERNRTCYFEIVDHSREGHIVVEAIAFSDSPQPPPAEEAPAQDAVPGPAPQPEVPESAFAMLASDHEPRNIRLHVRGNHLNLGDEVPRGILRTIAGETAPRQMRGSGRLELANWISSASNPLTARVMVNRIWKHHFGRGIVRSVDNLGAMGDAPTHPELLDYMAARFIESGWSIKAMHRLMLLSSAYQMSSESSAQAAAADPENKLLHHMPVRRLEGEAIRDAILTVAGTLDRTMFGPSVPPYISPYQDGRGKPKTGPLDGARRRSVYIQLRRNFLPPMFLAFDYPLPISSIGARTVSTVPSQALFMLNNEFVADQARKWAAQIERSAEAPQARVRRMYRTAFGREPRAEETAEILAFVSQNNWADVAHVLLNSAEFLYLR